MPEEPTNRQQQRQEDSQANKSIVARVVGYWKSIPTGWHQWLAPATPESRHHRRFDSPALPGNNPRPGLAGVKTLTRSSG